MPTREGEPPGVAYRLYERRMNGDRRLISIAFCMGSSSDEVRFRWAGSTIARVVPKKTWDGWEPEHAPNHKSRLWTKD